MWKIVAYVLSALVFAAVGWVVLPVLSLSFLTLPVMVGLFAGLCLLFNIPYKYPEKMADGKMHMVSTKGSKLGTMLWSGVMVLAFAYVLVAVIASSSIFTWETKQKELKIIENQAFDTSVPNVDMANLVILDGDDAVAASEKLITEKDPTMGSLYQMGEGTLTVVKGKPYWIIPMEHRGFFKWLKTKGVIPGYLMVSATNFNDAIFVDAPFKVSPSGYLGDDLKRSVYARFPQYGLTDFSFEPDDNGKPHWVVTAYTHATWASTTRVIGTIIVDPSTGEMALKKVGEQPEWVDRVYSMEIFGKQLDWYGEFINGWWNPSDTGKLQDTEGMGYVFINGQLHFYTGLTSVGKDSATTGFVIFNPRNGETIYNRISGSVEMKAVGLMEELVQNAGYTASFPYLINLNGEATYFSTLKGNSNNVVGYAFASVKNYKAVAWGPTLREAQTAYNRALVREGGGNTLAGQEAAVETVSGAITRIGLLSDGYYILMVEGNGRMFVVNSEQSPEVALTQVGDSVELTHLKTDDPGRLDAISFENKALK